MRPLIYRRRFLQRTYHFRPVADSRKSFTRVVLNIYHQRRVEVINLSVSPESDNIRGGDGMKNGRQKALL